VNKNIIVGVGEALQIACGTADEMQITYQSIELFSLDRYNFDLSSFLSTYPASTGVKAFVALDCRAVNYARLKLIADIRSVGYGSLNLISPHANVASQVKIGGNVHVGAGCNISMGAQLGIGCWLDEQVVLGRGAKLGNCVTLLAGSKVGSNSIIGRGTTLGEGAVAVAGSKVGRHCEWLLPSTVPQVLADRSFFDRDIPDGAQVFN